MKLKNIEFGENDGKNEANLPNFESLFFNHNQIYEKSLHPQNFIITGRRGSGKTTLVEYLMQKKNSQNEFCRKDSYESFRLNQLIEIKNSQISKVEYYHIWKWTILIELAKLIISKSNFLINSNQLKILKNFIDNNDYHLALGGNKTISTLKEKTLSGSLEIETKVESGKFFKYIANAFAKIKGTVSNNKKEAVNSSPGNYLNYLNSLEEIIFKVLEHNKEKSFFLIYDELDSFFEVNTEYKKIILDLIRCIESFNIDFRKKQVKCKIIVCLRTDILNLMNYPGLNKLRTDSTLDINWNVKDELSPLVHLIANKIKESNPEYYKGKDSKTIFYSIFEKQKLKISDNKFFIHNYILNKTLLRPRDIVTFFSFLKKNFGEIELINQEMLFSAEKEYSNYFLGEIRSELCGHFEDSKIDSCIELLKTIKQRTFSFEYLKDKSSKLTSPLEEKILKEIFVKLFEHGAIGNIIIRNNGKKQIIHRYDWYYRNPSCYLDFNEKLIFHFGLYKILNLI